VTNHHVGRSLELQQHGAFRIDLPGLALRVSAPKAHPDEVRATALRHREQLDAFLASRRSPESVPHSAPRAVALVADAAVRCGLHPEDAVSGALTQALGEGLAKSFGEAIVEAPGLSFVFMRRDHAVRVQGVGRAFSVWVGAGRPLAVFSSSTRLKPLPGDVDGLVVIAHGCAVAEAAALSAAALVRAPDDVISALHLLRSIDGVRGALVVKDEVTGVYGGMRVEAAA
jgi:ApbE superfamily uncharacterized protein (UPF0280 family)